METADCVDDATCINTVGSFTCTCLSGFSGDGRASPGGTGCTGLYTMKYYKKDLFFRLSDYFFM